MDNNRIVTIRDILDTQYIFATTLCAAGHKLTTDSNISKKINVITWVSKGQHHSATITFHPHGSGTSETAELIVDFARFEELNPNRSDGLRTDRQQWKMVEGEAYGTFTSSWKTDKSTSSVPELLAKIVTALSVPIPVRSQ